MSIEYQHKYYTRSKANYKQKKISKKELESSDDDDFIDDYDSTDYDSDINDFNKILTKLIPSKYIKKNSNIKQKKNLLNNTAKKYFLNKLKKYYENKKSELDDPDYNPSEEDEMDEEEIYEEQINEEELNEENNSELDNNKFNIILTIGNNNDEDEYYEDEYNEDEYNEDEYYEDDYNENEYNEDEYNEDEQINKDNKKQSLLKRTTTKNANKFPELLKTKILTNEIEYFRKNLSIEEQNKYINEIERIKNNSIVNKPYTLTLLDTDIPIVFKACALKKINTLKMMEPGSGEYYKIKNWVDAFMNIPFNKFTNFDIDISHGIEKCHNFIKDAQEILNNAVYGLDDAKLQIIQMIGQWIVNPNAQGKAIAIKGPMGTGKTTLVKEGISKILKRPFAFLALGGATDSSFLEGHSYTYEGSTWGKIIDILIQSKTMNPVIYFDELDKVSDTPKGDEIIGILTHLIDSSQSDKFHDKYFSELEFDLSKAMFIFSYNDESKVNPILLDRMYKISTKGYTVDEKLIIVNKYLLPAINKDIKFDKDYIIIPDESIKYIITTYTNNEQGVRNLKRCLEIIYTKLNLYRLMKQDENLFKKDLLLNSFNFPVTLNNNMIDQLIKKDKQVDKIPTMYI